MLVRAATEDTPRAAPLALKVGTATLRGVAIAAAVAGVWKLAVLASGVPPYILPPPERVAAAFLRNAPFLLGQAGITALEIVLGLVAGTVLGVVTALAMSFVPGLKRVVFPVLIVTQALPVVAIAPLLVVWFGYGIASKIVMATLIIYFPVTAAFFDGLARTDRHLLDLAQVAGASPYQRLVHIRIPAALPALATGLRVSAAVAPIGAVVGEWVGASAGLGFLMLHANARMQTDLLFAALAVLAIMALALRAAVNRLTRRMAPWAPET